MHLNPIFTTISLLAVRVVAYYGEPIGVPNNALGKCSTDTTLKAGDLCSTENWGAHGCGPGAEGNILLCDNHNNLGALMWSHYANCTAPEKGQGKSACFDCACVNGQLPRQYWTCRACPKLNPGDQYPCWANGEPNGCASEQWLGSFKAGDNHRQGCSMPVL